MNKPAWRDSAQIRSALEAAFNLVLTTRMHGLPMNNQSLSVQAVGFERFVDGDWLGVLITPWSMNLLLLPDEATDWSDLAAGSQFLRSFSYGDYLFTVGNEAELGIYGQCSLFSPMFEFADQAAAVATAQAALSHLIAAPVRAISRRDLLRGSLAKGSEA